MGTPADATTFGLALLKALGVDPHRVVGFDLHVRKGRPVTIRIDRYVEQLENETALVDVFQKVHLGQLVLSETFELEGKE